MEVQKKTLDLVLTFVEVVMETIMGLMKYLVGFDSIWNFQEDTYQNIYVGTNI